MSTNQDRCINCAISLKHSGKRTLVSELHNEDTNLRPLLEEWVSPVVLSPEHRVCSQCVGALSRGRRGGGRRFGHARVCAGCGRSTAREARARPLASRSHAERALFAEWTPDYAHPHFSTICYMCCRRVARGVAAAASGRGRPAAEFVAVAAPDPETVGEAESPANQEPRQARGRLATALRLASYRRTRAEPSRCMVARCGAASLHRVPLLVRQTLLARHNLYVPHEARACAAHAAHAALAGRGAELRARAGRGGFTGDDVADMLFLLRGVQPIYFDEVASLDPLLVKVWLGVTREEFTRILTATPALAGAEGAALALALYLARRCTGESEVVLASLFQLPREEVDAKLRLAKDCLERDATLDQVMESE